VLLTHSAARLGAQPTETTLEGLVGAVRQQAGFLSPQV
jgi:hypothetical protein